MSVSPRLRRLRAESAQTVLSDAERVAVEQRAELGVVLTAVWLALTPVERIRVGALRPERAARVAADRGELRAYLAGVPAGATPATATSSPGT